MTFLLIPCGLVDLIPTSPHLKGWLSEISTDTLPSPIRYESNQSIYTVAVYRHDNAILVLHWRDGVCGAVAPYGNMISIWCDESEATVFSFEPPEREAALDRICQLAHRIWAGQPLANAWFLWLKDGVTTIHAGGFRLRDIRMAYGTRKFDGSVAANILDIGAIFHTQQKSKSAALPTYPIHLLAFFRHPEMPVISVPEATSYDSHVDEGHVQIPSPEGSRHLYSMQYSEWVSQRGPLTRQQRKVINHKLHRPLRIHGPAGSGKTLVLVLKALTILREAQQNDRTCHLLLVVNSGAMKGTIKTAIEAIDDVGFMATNEDDPQFLDVDTLHGWCIRKLGVEQGPKYVQERNPTAARERQQQVLADVVDRLLHGIGDEPQLLSRDFRSRLHGIREYLLRDLAWEIAIRIKGRGIKRADQSRYVDNASRIPSFIGAGENRYDRAFIFRVYRDYEEHFEERGLLDTDDVVLSMSARLATSLWDRQRRELGYDFVFVDETHLFNENERRVLPFLTRGTEEFLPLVMTFDELQAIGGRRGRELAEVGIENSEKRTLTYVHRYSPDIQRVARALVENTALIFEVSDIEPISGVKLTEAEERKCVKPFIVRAGNEFLASARACEMALNLKTKNYQRVLIVTFSEGKLALLREAAEKVLRGAREIRERGDPTAAVNPGIFFALADLCGGLEFDAVLVVGADDGILPPSFEEISPEGHLALQEDACRELYVAITRARFQLIFISDSSRGVSPLLRELIASGAISDSPSSSSH